MSTSPRLVTRLALILAMTATTAAAPAAQSELVLTKPGSKEYHRPHCHVVKDGKNVTALTRAKAMAAGLTAHAVCDPAQAGPPPESSASAPAAPVYVYTDGSRYYHKKDCAKLGKDPDPKKTDLEEAGKKLWPCPTCKPPIRKRQR